MTQQEREKRFHVSITNSPEDPSAVDVQINWDNGKTDPLKRITYQENKRYPSLQDLVSKVSRERFLRDLQSLGAIITATAGASSISLLAAFAGNFGEYDLLIKIASGVAGVGATIGGVALAPHSAKESAKSSSILNSVEKTVNYSIASNPPQP